MATQKRQLALQVGNFPLPRVPVKFDEKNAKKWAESLLRALEDASFVMTGVQDNGTTQPIRSLIDFIGCSVTDDLTNDRTQVSVGGGAGAAPVNATYICVALNGTLTAERVLVARNGLTSTDAGANGNFTLDVVPAGSSHLVAGVGSLDWSGVTVKLAGSSTGTRRGINLISGGGLLVSETDNGGSDQVDVTLTGSWVRPFLTMGA